MTLTLTLQYGCESEVLISVASRCECRVYSQGVNNETQKSLKSLRTAEKAPLTVSFVQAYTAE